MAKIKKVEKSNIERARQLLLLEIFSERTDDRFIIKQVIKQLLGPLIAAKESGLSFEDIAVVFQKAGLEMSVLTLKTYYHELKTEDELARDAKKHAEKAKAFRVKTERELMEIHNDYGLSVAEKLAKGRAKEPTLYSIEDEPTKPGASEAAKPKASPSDKPGENPATTGTVVAAATTAAATPASPTAPTATAIPGPAMTIEELESVSLTKTEHTALTEDVTIKDGKVFYVSGKPFDGSLTKKQLLLLKTVGKLIAPTEGRSSKNFVVLPEKL